MIHELLNCRIIQSFCIQSDETLLQMIGTCVTETYYINTFSIKTINICNLTTFFKKFLAFSLPHCFQSGRRHNLRAWATPKLWNP